MAYDVIDLAEANRRLEQLIIGNWVIGFTTGDTWTLRLGRNNYYLHFNGMFSNKIKPLVKTLQSDHPDLMDHSDQDSIAWTTIWAAMIYRPIISATINAGAEIALRFEGGTDIIIATNTEIVDWQWSIGKENKIPYMTQADIACFERGEISG
ncbi:hypothetical protein [Yoonia sp. I 8.24]|uniref:hypothetical protein n=1 Tax=Yoonia sp. I 8.24 TaxID=1537229 RepID=UPI001EDEF467|nr:hypothetical protein [Yoonia sp. I 8.24]MCG3269234.1 hypothetical protein [Yoonia sp. I 8.24]